MSSECICQPAARLLLSGEPESLPISGPLTALALLDVMVHISHIHTVLLVAEHSQDTAPGIFHALQTFVFWKGLYKLLF